MSISSPTDLLKVLLQLGRQRPIEIPTDVGDSEEILSEPALFSWRLGTSLAFGLPGLAMTISSPATAPFTSFERFVLAS